MVRAGLGALVIALLLVAAPLSASTLTVNAAAALAGSSGSACGGNPCGLEVDVTFNDEAYVVSEHPNAEGRFDVSFRIAGNDLILPSGQFFVVFEGRRSFGPQASHWFGYVRRSPGSGGLKFIVVLREDSGSVTTVANINITNAGGNGIGGDLIQMIWDNGAGNGSFELLKNGTQRALVTTLDNDTYQVDTVNFGARFTNTAPGVGNSLYLDEYVSQR